MPKIGKTKPQPTTNTREQAPATLRPYIAHGVDLQWKGNDKEATADCPFCGREKFSVNIATGQWRCFVCGAGNEKGGGNIYVFLRCLHEESEKATQNSDYSTLAKDRTLEFPDTLVHWKLAKSIINSNWLVPAFGIDSKGKLVIKQLYQYVYSNKEQRWFLMLTPELGHQLFGIDQFDKTKGELHICEGIWNAMRYWEALRSTKSTSAGLATTGSVGSSLFASANILAVPGCQVFFDHWITWCTGRNVCLLYDSDHPKKHPRTGVTLAPAGYTGMKRTISLISQTAESMQYVKWGEGGYDPDLVSGHDVRDELTLPTVTSLQRLFDRIEPVPEDWKSAVGVSASSGEGINPVPCNNFADLTTAWRKALKWTPGLDHALVMMLAAISSTPSIGDQIWIKVIGPASSAKTTLCEAVSVAKKYVVAKSTIRGFHSGFKLNGDGTDHSLIPQIKGKTLVTKDGDTLLQSPNLDQILSEARDLYDGTSRTHYRNSIQNEYEGIRMTWLLCGTNSLRALDSSELGARFLDCVIMERIDEDLEEDIAWRVANKADLGFSVDAEGDTARQYDPELISAMELTGGYVEWLREHANSILPEVEFSDEAKRMCVKLGKFVAYTRARPSKKQNETVERELSARLVSQHVRVAKCAAYVLNKTTVDYLVMERVKRLSLDTARGQTLQIIALLVDHQATGLGLKSIGIHTNRPEEHLLQMMRFLTVIGVTETTTTVRYSSGTKWKLTPSMLGLYADIVGISSDDELP